MLKELEVVNVAEKVKATFPERKLKKFEPLFTSDFSEEDYGKIKYFSTSLNKEKKGDAAYTMIGKQLCKLIKDKNVTSVSNNIEEIKINDKRSMFKIGVVF